MHKLQYPNASILKGRRVVFNFGGNKYRMIAEVNYVKGVVKIRFLGAHKEYDRINADTV